MNLTKVKELFNFIRAAAEGKTIQFKNAVGDWIDLTVEEISNFSSTDLRIKPDSIVHPWHPEPIPIGAWLRPKKRKWAAMIVATGERHFVVGSNIWQYHSTPWHKLEWSPDRGQNWLPCIPAA